MDQAAVEVVVLLVQLLVVLETLRLSAQVKVVMEEMVLLTVLLVVVEVQGAQEVMVQALRWHPEMVEMD